MRSASPYPSIPRSWVMCLRYAPWRRAAGLPVSHPQCERPSQQRCSGVPCSYQKRRIRCDFRRDERAGPMTPQQRDPREADPGDVSDFTGRVSRRRLLGRGAVGAGLAVAGGALLSPRAASAADNDPVLAANTVSGLTGETGLSGACSPSVLRLAQSSTTGDGLVVALSDTGAAGHAVKVNQAGTASAIDAQASGSSTASAITAAGTAALPANNG